MSCSSPQRAEPGPVSSQIPFIVTAAFAASGDLYCRRGKATQPTFQVARARHVEDGPVEDTLYHILEHWDRMANKVARHLLVKHSCDGHRDEVARLVVRLVHEQPRRHVTEAVRASEPCIGARAHG
eukprot:scaffold260866_cov32-Tisochrysis_lutea.AAC.1